MDPASEYFAIKSKPVIDKLKALGISAEAVIKGGGWKPKLVCVERLSLPQRRNHFSWCFREDGEPAFVMPVDSQNQTIDWLAFTEKWFLPRYGSAFCLGEDNLSAPCIFDEPLAIWRHPLGWLRANCAGICILQPDRVHIELGNVPFLKVEDQAHAREITKLLIPPLSQTKIFYPREKVAA